MNKSFEIRIYPNKEQQKLIDKTCNYARFIYNFMLEFKQKYYKYFNKGLTCYDMYKILTKLKKRKSWLKDVDVTALRSSIKNLDQAFQRFFNGAGYPKFKSKKRGKLSYRTNSNIILDQDNKKIRIPKVGWIKFRDKNKFEGLKKIYNITISKTASGKYFASISAEVDITAFERTNQKCGIDLGIKDFCILNNGNKVNNPKFLVNNERRLRLLKKSLGRKIKGSKNYEKARIRLAKAISDVSWFEFCQQLEYKSLWYDKKFVQINTYFASSQICSDCEFKNSEIKDLEVREWICPNCGSHHDRDINAATNILKEGLKLI